LTDLNIAILQRSDRNIAMFRSKYCDVEIGRSSIWQGGQKKAATANRGGASLSETEGA
jgi:hypothetical protein